MLGCALFLCAAPLSGQVRMTKEDALKQYFPEALIERRTAFLSPEQVEQIQERARARVESRILTYYVARGRDGIVGTAFFETQTIRTMPATYMTVIGPDTCVQAVEILAFHEPADYAPSARWLAQFAGGSADDDLFLKRGVQNIAGATMTAQVLSSGIRRLLTSYEVVVAPALEVQ